MCTILTVNSKFDKQLVVDRITTDGYNNPDGFSLMVQKGRDFSMTRSTSLDLITDLVWYSNWDRIWLHSRFATQGSVSLENTHGWNHDSTYVMHNGCLSDADTAKFPVDSQLIVDWVRLGGVPLALAKLKFETFANVFLIDSDTGEYTVHRTGGGSLYMDGIGNYSTQPFGDITKIVPNSTVIYEYCPMPPKPIAYKYSAYKDEWAGTGIYGSGDYMSDGLIGEIDYLSGAELSRLTSFSRRTMYEIRLMNEVEQEELFLAWSAQDTTYPQYTANQYLVDLDPLDGFSDVELESIAASLGFTVDELEELGTDDQQAAIDIYLDSTITERDVV